MRWITSIVSCLVCLSVGVAAENRPPNIVIILADDLGFSDLGCYGGEISTPVLDDLAKNGLRFSQFYNTARCWPTRAALLTGYYAQSVRRDAVPGVKSGGQGLRPKWAPLVSELLQKANYRTYHSGKWHVDGKPIECGFNSSYQLEDHDRHLNPQRHLLNSKPLPPITTIGEYTSSHGIASYAIDQLKDHARNYSENPFFSFVAFTAPHFPLHAPEADIQLYEKRYAEGWDQLRFARWNRMKSFPFHLNQLPEIERDLGPPYSFPKAFDALGPNEVNRPVAWNSLTASQQQFQARKMAIHAAMVTGMDRAIGRIMKQIRDMNQFDSTLVIFLSDNGASGEMMIRGDGHAQSERMGSEKTFLCLGPGGSSLSNTPFRRHKTWVHEGGISTPCIMSWPGHIKDVNSWRTTPAHVIDIVPTILEFASVSAPKEWKGVSVPNKPGMSLTQSFQRETKSQSRSLWWQHEQNRAYRQGDWKIVASGKERPWELYDLSVDRGEVTNLADRYPERVNKLAAEWEQLRQQWIRYATDRNE
ncbi:sulfatase-like hydrolase/transferase [Tuwongella immobilis]|uniref:Sulfatase N-terminal domain-containing protein n=1 Tax=Tuwongella immobilis TaxID=692036 RepID=A0A6C2YNJ7_9BACT|nr:sulfatase-like hydrolase/transferase [Tuwongella immobilis]VIP02861.1 arylsulfatase : Sulfatase OS=Chthoniobacter flavus Ellin428 GN=CfE428DRAFT_4340 PE=4 SV=1: Sulfatase [Tuwongella immobilis]VTS02671.1 arylsulfatase : Sulfatase OS=Chthoniobacter flavus Ellin428 GN=CfE428DRAFT_4340 PE=4 SV=1: Sulfatase [Tuwongella immobilis]